MMSRSVKFIFILTFLALSAFYLYVLYLTKHPNVSLAYRMYYIEQKTRIWDRNQTLAYIPGTEMVLTKYRDRCPYLSRAGWDIPKEDGSGSVFSGNGGLYFTLHADPGALNFEGTFTSPNAGTTLTVSIGDQWSQTIQLENENKNHFSVTIPATLLVADPETPNFISLKSNSKIKFQSFKLSYAG